jgi:hypothetical protein
MEVNLTPEQELRLADESEREIIRQRTEQAIRIGLRRLMQDSSSRKKR